MRPSARLAAVGAAALVLLAGCSPAPDGDPQPTPPVTGTGGVASPAYPELSVTEEPGRLIVAVADPRAKAWRVDVRGTGSAAAQLLEIYVETGDVEFNVIARSSVGREVIDEADLSGLVGDESAAAGGCHPSLKVCFSSTGIALPEDSRGVVEVTFDLPLTAGPLEASGATSVWSEPFVFGPWQDTAAFTTAG